MYIPYFLIHISVSRWQCTVSIWKILKLISKAGSNITKEFYTSFYIYSNNIFKHEKVLKIWSFRDNLNILAERNSRVPSIEENVNYFLITVYKIYQLLYFHTAYFIFIIDIELLNFKIRASFFFFLDTL